MQKAISYLRRVAPRWLIDAVGRPMRDVTAAAAAPFMDELERLGVKYASDKYAHGYLPHYARHFAGRRHRVKTILEIGVGGFEDPTKGGDSLRMWEQYFPNAQIHGIDIHDKTAHDTDRITTHLGGQDDPEFLRALIEKIGTPDIIIDDGSHLNEHILISFEALFPLLARDGIYAIEDMQTAYLYSYGGSCRTLNSPKLSTGFLKTLVDVVNWKSIPDRQSSPHDGEITGISVYPKLCFIEKGDNNLVLSGGEISMMETALKRENEMGSRHADEPAA
ncbi:MAG: class I SAM-dependent methyltransferase [Pseudomonadota bacterium]